MTFNDDLDPTFLMEKSSNLWISTNLPTIQAILSRRKTFVKSWGTTFTGRIMVRNRMRVVWMGKASVGQGGQ